MNSLELKSDPRNQIRKSASKLCFHVQPCLHACCTHSHNNKGVQTDREEGGRTCCCHGNRSPPAGLLRHVFLGVCETEKVQRSAACRSHKCSQQAWPLPLPSATNQLAARPRPRLQRCFYSFLIVFFNPSFASLMLSEGEKWSQVQAG